MGFWTECINPFHSPVMHYFYSNGHIYDNAKMCPGCWYKAGHKELIYVPIRQRPKNSRIDSKPEKDSL